jgi:fucose permease
MNQETKWSQFGTLISVFFFWGFVAASNGIFIPFCKTHFNLTQFQSQLIDTAFYGAYFFGSLILFLFSTAIGRDYLNQIGYKKGIIIGLLISVLGALGLLFAVNYEKKEPILSQIERIKTLDRDLKVQTSDQLIEIRKDSVGYSLIADSAATAYFKDSSLLAMTSTGKFTADIKVNRYDSTKKTLTGYSAKFEDAQLPQIVQHLDKQYGSTLTFGMFALILIAFFVLALGFSLQQTSAQPFVVAMGSPETGAHRLNMAGGINSFGTLLGPILVSLILFGSAAAAAKASIGQVKTVYYILIGLFSLVALIFAISKLPRVTNNDKMESSSKAVRTLLIIALLYPLIIAGEQFSKWTGIPKVALVAGSLAVTFILLFYAYMQAKKNPNGWGAMQYPQLILGMMAIYVYVGVEVTIQSNFGALLKLESFGNYSESEISHFISCYWGSLMIGRWTGATAVFNLDKSKQRILTVVAPFIAYAVILLANIIAGNHWQDLLWHIPAIVILVGAFIWSEQKPVKMMLAFSALGAIAMLIGMITTGTTATFAFISGGLFCSVMWPCIFSLAIMGLGKWTSQGSAFLIMMILGGAVIPPLQGAIADTAIGIHYSYIVAVICFVFLIWYTISTRRALQAQGINFDNAAAGGGH